MSLAGKGNPKEDYHFTTPQRREEMRSAAYETGNLELFGQYLHAFQDSFSHQKDGVPYNAAFGHITTPKPDLTRKRPDLADEMAKTTYNEMQNFLQYRNGISVNNNWSTVKPAVQKFNRLKTMEDKQNALSQ